MTTPIVPIDDPRWQEDLARMVQGWADEAAELYRQVRDDPVTAFLLCLIYHAACNALVGGIWGALTFEQRATVREWFNSGAADAIERHPWNQVPEDWF